MAPIVGILIFLAILGGLLHFQVRDTPADRAHDRARRDR